MIQIEVISNNNNNQSINQSINQITSIVKTLPATTSHAHPVVTVTAALDPFGIFLRW